ncbi:MAG: hypothetical protein V6Z81_08195 [Parvularculales bacterium]
MRNISILLCICSLFFIALGDRVCVHAQTKTADKLWVEYQNATLSAATVSSNYYIQVDAADDTNKQLAVVVGLYTSSVSTLVVAGIGQVKPTLAIVKGWLSNGNLSALKVLADQAMSDAHKEAADSAKKKTSAYDDYLAQFGVENPGYGTDGYTGPAPMGRIRSRAIPEFKTEVVLEARRGVGSMVYMFLVFLIGIACVFFLVFLLKLCLLTRSKGLILLTSVILIGSIFEVSLNHFLDTHISRWVTGEVHNATQRWNVAEFLGLVFLIKHFLYITLCGFSVFLIYREWRARGKNAKSV